MATIDKTHLDDFAQKKLISSASCLLAKDDFKDTDKLKLFNLPEQALVIGTFVIAKAAGQSGLTLKVDIGSTTIVSAAAVSTKDTIVKSNTNDFTLTGKAVYVTPSAKPTSGEFYVIIHYIEPTVSTGNLTQY